MGKEQHVNNLFNYMVDYKVCWRHQGGISALPREFMEDFSEEVTVEMRL